MSIELNANLTKYKAQLVLMGMLLVLQVLDHKPKYLTNEI